jgi:RimJ/RimL family protein N-acetyltransferase
MADIDRSHLGLTAPIVTARLILRSVQTADDEMLTRIWTDPDVRRYMGGPLEPGVVRHRNTDFVGKPGKYCVAIRATGEPIGLLGIGADRRIGNWEVSYGILPEHWRRGYAREAVHALLVWVFERVPDAKLIAANTRADNEPSRRFLEAIGGKFVESFGDRAESVMYAVPRTGAPGETGSGAGAAGTGFL